MEAIELNAVKLRVPVTSIDLRRTSLPTCDHTYFVNTTQSLLETEKLTMLARCPLPLVVVRTVRITRGSGLCG